MSQKVIPGRIYRQRAGQRLRILAVGYDERLSEPEKHPLIIYQRLGDDMQYGIDSVWVCSAENFLVDLEEELHDSDQGFSQL